MPNEIELSGMDELVKKLEYMVNPAQQSKMTSSALKAGAIIIQEKVKPKIPKSDLSKEHAADHIIVSNMKRESGVPYVAVGPDPGDNSEYFYLKFYEFGTHVPNALGKIIPALHMFGTTIVEEAQNVKDAMAAIIREGLGL